jgi:hypothetical protein
VAFICLGCYRRIGIAIGVSLVGTLLMLFFFMRVALHFAAHRHTAILRREPLAHAGHGVR